MVGLHLERKKKVRYFTDKFYFGGDINWCVVNDIKPEYMRQKKN